MRLTPKLARTKRKTIQLCLRFKMVASHSKRDRVHLKLRWTKHLNYYRSMERIVKYLCGKTELQLHGNRSSSSLISKESSLT